MNGDLQRTSTEICCEGESVLVDTVFKLCYETKTSKLICMSFP